MICVYDTFIMIVTYNIPSQLLKQANKYINKYVHKIPFRVHQQMVHGH